METEVKMLRVLFDFPQLIDEHPFIFREGVLKNKTTQDFAAALFESKDLKGYPLRKNIVKIIGIEQGKERASAVVKLVTTNGGFECDRFAYEQEIFNVFAKRSISSLGRRIIESEDSERDYSDFITEIDKTTKILEDSLEKDSDMTNKQAVDAVFEKLAKLAKNDYSDYIQTGIKNLDDMIIGFQRKTMNVIGARPAVGKTAFGLSLITAIDANGGSAGFISVEMGKVSLMERLIQIRSGVSSMSLVNSQITEIEVDDYKTSARYFRKSNIQIYDTTNRDISNIRRILRKMKNDNKEISLVVIDYLQKITVFGSRDKRTEVDEVAQQLTDIAKELNICVIALAQLNRNSDGGKPKMGDLKESSCIEQEAHIIALLNRDIDEQYQCLKAPSKRDVKYKDSSIRSLKCALDIVKNRDGKSGGVPLLFDAPVTSFRSAPVVDDADVPVPTSERRI